MFLFFFLNTLPWSSDRDPQRRFPVFKRFGPLNLLTFSEGGPHPVISRMSLSDFILRNPTLTAGYERLSLAFLCRSLPGMERLRKLSMASSCHILPAFDLQPSIMRGSI